MARSYYRQGAFCKHSADFSWKKCIAEKYLFLGCVTLCFHYLCVAVYERTTLIVRMNYLGRLFEQPESFV